MIIPFIAQNAPRVPFWVVVLIRPHRVDKRGQPGTAEYQGNWDQIRQDTHLVTSTAMRLEKR